MKERSFLKKLSPSIQFLISVSDDIIFSKKDPAFASLDVANFQDFLGSRAEASSSPWLTIQNLTIFLT